MKPRAALSSYLSILVIVLCLLVFAGWQFDVSVLRSLVPGAPVTTPLTASLLLLLGAALFLASIASGERRALAGPACVLLAGLVLLAAAYTSIEYVLDFDSALNRLLYPDKVAASGGLYPGRPSPQTIVTAALLAGAIGLSPIRGRLPRRASTFFEVLATATMWLVLFGYASTTNPFYLMPGNPETGMSPITAASFLLLLVGTIGLRPTDGLAGLVLARSSGGRLVRRLLPFVIAVPLLLGWLAASGSARGLFDPSLGFALNWGFTSLLFAVMLLWQGHTLNEHDRERSRVTAEREQVLSRLETANARIRKQTRELERSNDDLKQFAYVASHDLQAPLRGISGFAQLLKEEYSGKLDASADDWIDRITQSTRKMQALISDLLEYARVESRSAEFTRVPLQEAFDAAVAMLQPIIAESNASVTASALPAVSGNGLQLTRLFQNLLGNALKYCEGRPQIKVTARKVGEMWEVAVSDNGIGIDPKYHNKIFEIFGRLHGEQEYSGTGLGLALCRRIVNRHEGSIRLESSVGTGSTFYISLPEVSGD